MSNLFSLLCLMFIPSCNNPDNRKIETDLSANYNISWVKASHGFDLDYNVRASTKYIGTFQINDRDYLFYKHRGLNKATIFDINTQKTIKTITWEIEGPNAVSPQAEFGYAHNFDSLFLYSILENTIFLIDSAGDLKNKYVLNYPISRPTGTHIHPENLTPISFNGTKLYFPTIKSYWGNFKEAKGLISYDIAKNLVEYEIDYPSVYFEGWWEHFHTLSSNVFGKNNWNVVSFAINPYIQVYDGSTLITQKYAGSTKVIAYPKHFNKPGNFSIDAFEKYYKNIALTGWYIGLKYDPSNKRYYRFGYYPISEEYVSSDQIYSNPFVIILDDEFNKIGEVAIPHRYKPSRLFVSSNGLNIFNEESFMENENILPFDTMVLDKIK